MALRCKRGACAAPAAFSRIAVVVCLVLAVLLGPADTNTLRADEAIVVAAAASKQQPQERHHTVYVIGDSLAHGAWTGLYSYFRDKKNVKIKRKTKISTGLANRGKFNWQRAASKIARGEKIDAVVYMFGANDILPIWTSGRSFAFGEPGWKQEYGARIDRLVEIFKAQKVPVYWIGIPIVRRTDYRRYYKVLNEVYAKAAKRNQIEFFENWSRFAKSGEYTSYGKSVAGKKVRLRANDGIHFTPAGYLKLAWPVGDKIARQFEDGLTDTPPEQPVQRP